MLFVRVSVETSHKRIRDEAEKYYLHTAGCSWCAENVLPVLLFALTWTFGLNMALCSTFDTGNFRFYLERQLKNYERALKKQKSFEMNDIVGLKIAEVDRSNTAPSVLPCKIIEIMKRDGSSGSLYKVATVDGIISDAFSSADFIDLNETVSADLRQTDCASLSTISFIQACQIFTQYKSIRACKCTGPCETNRCPCKKQSVKCCSKCHRGKSTTCKNRT